MYYPERMNELIHLLNGLDYPQPLTPTHLEGVLRYRETRSSQRAPLLIEPTLCVLVSGSKNLYSGGQQIIYNANRYLVSSSRMPVDCEVEACPERPALGISIRIETAVLLELLPYVDQPPPMPLEHTHALTTSPLDKVMREALFRLITCSADPRDAQVLGPGIVREILYRALTGGQAPMLFELANRSGKYARMARVIDDIQDRLNEKIDVNELAHLVDMSSSAFHRSFKTVFGASPMQHLKKLRLNKARELLRHEGLKAYEAADAVGYESVSQFNREFKRYFGHTPGSALKQ